MCACVIVSLGFAFVVCWFGLLCSGSVLCCVGVRVCVCGVYVYASAYVVGYVAVDVAVSVL